MGIASDTSPARDSGIQVHLKRLATEEHRTMGIASHSSSLTQIKKHMGQKNIWDTGHCFPHISHQHKRLCHTSLSKDGAELVAIAKATMQAKSQADACEAEA